jgi:spore photoproduct lyase
MFMLYERTIDHLLTIQEIYHVKKSIMNRMSLSLPGGREILAKYPNAKLIEVHSHNKIPKLFGFAGAVEDWLWRPNHGDPKN